MTIGPQINADRLAYGTSLPDKHTVLLYVYTDDVEAARASLVEAGLNPSPITTPFYARRGEFEIVDPDGYVVMVTHT